MDLSTRLKAQRMFGLLLLLILSGLFIFSAITKLIAIEPFEWTFMDLGLSDSLAYFFARLFIGLEFVIGLFLLAHLYLRKLTYPLTLGLLSLLTLYLIIVVIRQGNTGDCGCFGDTLHMSPLQGIIKNIGLIALTIVLQQIYTPKPYRFQLPLAAVSGLAMLALPFCFMPLMQKPQPVKLDALYLNPTGIPPIELRKGKHVVAFMSSGCPHCRTAAKVLRDMYAADTTLPIFIVLNGWPEQAADFFKDTKADKVPHMLFTGVSDFIKMAGPYVPAIYWVNNSVKERKVSFNQLNAAAIKAWAAR
jgi:hypothetical protein